MNERGKIWVTWFLTVLIAVGFGYWARGGVNANENSLREVDGVVAPVGGEGEGRLQAEFGDEYETIMAAAARNGCKGEDLFILFAIRKADNGPPGNEFGVMCQKGTDLDTQAGWAAATIVKNRQRWLMTICGEDFITFLGDRYCPAETDPVGNKNWKRNVMYWTAKLSANG